MSAQQETPSNQDREKQQAQWLAGQIAAESRRAGLVWSPAADVFLAAAQFLALLVAVMVLIVTVLTVVGGGRQAVRAAVGGPVAIVFELALYVVFARVRQM